MTQVLRATEASRGTLVSRAISVLKATRAYHLLSPGLRVRRVLKAVSAPKVRKVYHLPFRVHKETPELKAHKVPVFKVHKVLRPAFRVHKASLELKGLRELPPRFRDLKVPPELKAHKVPAFKVHRVLRPLFRDLRVLKAVLEPKVLRVPPLSFRVLRGLKGPAFRVLRGLKELKALRVLEVVVGLCS